MRHQKRQSRDEFNRRWPELIKELESMGSFYMELRWEFHSWIPLVSRVLPSDVCKIYKKGADLRVDTTLLDFNGMKWERGSTSFLFQGKGYRSRLKKYRPPTPSTSDETQQQLSYNLIVMDNKQKVFQRITHQQKEQNIDHEVDILMSCDTISAKISTKLLNFEHVSQGWIFKSNKEVKVGSFHAEVYAANGFNIESLRRREHLTNEDLKENKAMLDSLTSGPEILTNSVRQTYDSPCKSPFKSPFKKSVKKRSSLLPPSFGRSGPSWSEYISAPAGHHPNLGRSHVTKARSKSFKATLAMSQDFPVTVDAFLNVLEILIPVIRFKKIRESVKTKLPPGFPIKIEVPILPTVTAKVVFQKFVVEENRSDDFFDVPVGYSEGVDGGIDWNYVVIHNPWLQGF